MREIDDSTDFHETEIGIGEEISITLHGASGSGYGWAVRSSGAPIVAVDASSAPPGERKPGSPRRWVFRCRGEQAGTTTVELVYRRAWDSEAPPRKTFTLRVTVLGGGAPGHTAT
ncbi:MAG TPA: protease inhibitor I42 family protein [Polyangiaceae bacterium]|nr:protease inhibitor I42 family protein [Polyangiaceae bacterium]